MKWYLTGPMSGIPQFNIPAFDAAAKYLRDSYGLNIISPPEVDTPAVRAASFASPDGVMSEGKIGGESWGQMLSRDVRIVADEAFGLILLDGWERSRGARLEVFVGLLTGKRFRRLSHEGTVGVTEDWWFREWSAADARFKLEENMP